MPEPCTSCRWSKTSTTSRTPSLRPWPPRRCVVSPTSLRPGCYGRTTRWAGGCVTCCACSTMCRSRRTPLPSPPCRTQYGPLLAPRSWPATSCPGNESHRTSYPACNASATQKPSLNLPLTPGRPRLCQRRRPGNTSGVTRGRIGQVTTASSRPRRVYDPVARYPEATVHARWLTPPWEPGLVEFSDGYPGWFWRWLDAYRGYLPPAWHERPPFVFASPH